MSRPRKHRRVCGLPESNRFGPLKGRRGQEEFLIMTIDEYETIRLIDLEGLTQDECSKQMNIGRTTVQGIYSQAREKIAKSIVDGKVLKIEGGNYKLCSNFKEPCNGIGCRYRFAMNHKHNEGRIKF